MERMYRCTSCGLRSRVVRGAAQATSIHCPRCGGEAVQRPGWSDAPGGPVVQIDLGDDAAEPAFDEAPFDPDGATERQDGPTRRAGEGPGPHARDVDEGRDPAVHDRDTLPVSFESERRRAPEAKPEPTPVGPPPRALSSTPRAPRYGLDEAPVTAIANLEAGASDRGEPRYPVLSEPVVEEPLDVERTTRRYAALDLGHEREGGGPEPVGESTPSGVPWPGASRRPPAHMGEDPGAWSPAPVPAPRFPASGQEDIARGGRGLEGKAWSASGIQRALRREGLGTEDRTPMPQATPTRGLGALPPKPRVHVQGPDGDGGAGGATDPAAPTLPPLISPEGGPSNADPPTAEPLRPPGRRRKRRAKATADYQAATPLSGPGLRDRSAGSRLLIILTVCAAVLAVGVVVGIVWYQEVRSLGEPAGDGFSETPPSEETLALAQRRADVFALEPLNLSGPAEVAWRLESVDYPHSLRLVLRVTNRSSESLVGVHLTAIWLVVHDVPAMARAAVESFTPAISASTPLEPGDQATAVLDLVLDDPPPGEARESFVWLDVTAADAALDIAFEGGAAMVEVVPE